MEHHAGQASSFEKILFGCTRGVALLAAFIALIGIAWCGVHLVGSFDKSSRITYAETTARLASSIPSGSPAGTTPINGASYSIPASVSKYMSGNNDEILRGWLNSIDNDDDKQDFLDNLSEVITQAEANNAEVVNVINAYKELKMKKVSQGMFDKYA
jgi:hypothetical protein